MKKILVPCDFSEPAIEAFRFALDVAAQSNGSVHLFYVAEPQVLSDPVTMSMDIEQQFLNDILANSEKEFKKITSKYSRKGVVVATGVEFGIPSRKILDYIIDNSIDLVVMGSHGATGLREIFIGSNAEKIVRKASVPVLVLKNYVKGPIKNIVFPNTFESENIHELMTKIKALQDFFDAQLHLVRINTPVNFISDSVILERLRNFAKYYALKNYTTNVFNNVSEEGGILKFTKSIQGELVAMGTHGRTGIKHLLTGSIAEDVVNHSNGLIWTYALKDEFADA